MPFSIIFVFGPWGKPRIERSLDFERIVVGWFAVWILYHDFEVILSKFDNIMDQLEEYKKRDGS